MSGVDGDPAKSPDSTGGEPSLSHRSTNLLDIVGDAVIIKTSTGNRSDSVTIMSTDIDIETEMESS